MTDKPIVIEKSLSHTFKNEQQNMIDSINEHRVPGDFSFPIKMTKNFQLLYNEFEKVIFDTFKKVTPLKNTWHNIPKCWAYVFDNTTHVTSWHNHIDSATINGVFYLKLTGKKENGIGFRYEENEFAIVPNEFDLLIFSGKTEHIPLRPDNNSLRISINMECMCEESIDELFKIENLKI